MSHIGIMFNKVSWIVAAGHQVFSRNLQRKSKRKKKK
jgi:hypothetical protein